MNLLIDQQVINYKLIVYPQIREKWTWTWFISVHLCSWVNSGLHFFRFQVHEWMNVAHIFGEHELKFKFILSSFKDLKNSQFEFCCILYAIFLCLDVSNNYFFQNQITENRQMINLNFRVIFGQIFRQILGRQLPTQVRDPCLLASM